MSHWQSPADSGGLGGDCKVLDSKSVLFLVAWFRTCYCFDYWLRFCDSILLSFLVAWIRSCDCVTLVMWLYDSMSVLFLVAWLQSHDSRLVTALTIWLRFHDSHLLSFLVAWLWWCDSMTPSLFHFWLHDSRIVTALTIDSGSVTLFCFHFWLLDSRTVTLVLWLCDSGYVIQIFKHLEGQPKLHASGNLSEIWGIQNAIQILKHLKGAEFQASRRSTKITCIQNSGYMEGQSKLHASRISSRIWGIRNAIQNLRYPECHPEFEASGISGIQNFRPLPNIDLFADLRGPLNRIVQYTVCVLWI